MRIGVRFLEVINAALKTDCYYRCYLHPSGSRYQVKLQITVNTVTAEDATIVIHGHHSHSLNGLTATAVCIMGVMLFLLSFVQFKVIKKNMGNNYQIAPDTGSKNPVWFTCLLA